jgi:hypothetical protein
MKQQSTTPPFSMIFDRSTRPLIAEFFPQNGAQGLPERPESRSDAVYKYNFSTHTTSSMF